MKFQTNQEKSSFSAAEAPSVVISTPPADTTNGSDVLAPFAEREKNAPPFILRKDLAKHTGGLLNPATIANRESLSREDPTIACIDGRCRVGNRVAYPAASVFAYLRRIISPDPVHPAPPPSDPNPPDTDSKLQK